MSSARLSIILIYLIFVTGKKIPIRKFFASTTLLLVFIAAGLIAYGTHEIETYLYKSNYIEKENLYDKILEFIKEIFSQINSHNTLFEALEQIIVSYEEIYPAIISLGSMWKFSQKSKLFLQHDSSDEILDKTKIGYEFLGFENFAIRCGYDLNKNMSLGFGYNFNINQLPILLDYAVDLGNQGEGLSHLFTWSIGLDE